MAEKSPPKVFSLLNADVSEMSKVERLKAESEGLFWVAGKEKHSFRSEIDAMVAGDAKTLSNEAKELSKHFGIYKQQERVAGRKTDNYIFMIRLRLPSGGELSAPQWDALCEASDRFADGTLRLTTRQAIQYHYVTGAKLGALVRFLNEDYPNLGLDISTLAACGDVSRNTMCSVADDLIADQPMNSREIAFGIADDLAPRTSSYFQIFLTDDEGKTKTPMNPEEPIYGKQYLPRKFKVGIAHPQDNSIDMLTQDVGLLPVGEGDEFDLYAGGGMGTTHGQEKTKALLGLYLGRVPRAQAIEAVRAIAIIQKENGERKDRRQARWKYTIRRMGIEAVQDLLRERFKIDLKDAAALPVPPNLFFHGWFDEAGDAGKLFLGIPVPSGRVQDVDGVKLRSAIAAIVATVPGIGVRITGNQDLLLTHIPANQRDQVEGLLSQNGVTLPADVSAFRRQAFGCPALPTCGLAMTDAENAIPGLADAVEAAGVGDVDVVVRMAGCPNHCSRPPSAEIGITGFGKNAHLIAVGGSREGTRIAQVLYPKLESEQLVAVLIGLLRAIKEHNPDGLPAGEYLHATPPEKLREYAGVEA